MLAIVKMNKWIGGRILKTGIAVLLTAFLCYLLDWPAMFAVITAIVTIEPTAQDSIKKAFVRFPASAIGAAYSVIFTFLLGDSPFSYAFVTLGTIYTCHRLGLHAGILVATLTGVAMISTIHDDYLSSFFVRLGTTTIGLSVSSLVNLLVIRPNYAGDITAKRKHLLTDMVRYMQQRGNEIKERQSLHKETKQLFQAIQRKLEIVETLCGYQKKEWAYHRFRREEIRVFHYENKKIAVLHQLIYHMGNLHALPMMKKPLDEETKQALCATIEMISKLAKEGDQGCSDGQRRSVEKLLHQQLKLAQLHVSRENHGGDGHLIPDEASLLFELASIIDLAEELRHIRQLELRHHRLVDG